MHLPLNEGETGVTIILIAYNNQGKFKTRLERDVLPTITAHPHWRFQIIIVDNSDNDDTTLCAMLPGHNLKYIYLRAETNLQYGPAMNLALKVTENPYIIYVCTNHGRMYDSTWIDDLLTPLINDRQVAMTGSFSGSCNPVYMSFPEHLAWVHIQGGVFGARTEALKAYPYTNDQRWAHLYSDIYQCYQLVNAGFMLYNVSTVCSLWRQSVNEPERWKYVHDSSEE